MTTFIDGKLREIYHDPESPGGLGGVQRLYKEARRRGLKVTLKKTKEFLASQETYSLFKPVVRRYKRNPILVKGINKIWSADLMDVSNLARFNDGIRFLLVTIDNFTKRVHVRPVKRKDGATIAKAFESIFSQSGPITFIWTDMGQEFLAKVVQDVFKKYNVKHYTTKNTETKASISERFFLTLRNRLHRYLHSRNTTRYIDVLPALLKAYESSYHRSIKMRPIDVDTKNERLVYTNLYGKGFEIDDLVKLSKLKGVFEKGYDPNWTKEEFKISGKKLNQKIPMFKVVDLENKPISGSFYKQELQKVISEPDRLYKVEKILKQRKRGGKIEYLVKWLGFPITQASWTTDLIDLST